MRAEPIPLVGGAYTDDARPWSMQDTCNYLPTSAERNGTRSPDKLKTPPGLRPSVEVITEVSPGIEEYTPVRGVHEAEGRLFAVIGETLYRISSAGVAIPLGTVPGRGRVSMEHNQISLGNELTVMNGSAGYVYNTVTDTFERISDPGFPGSLISLFIDGYIIGIEPQGRYAFNSAPADALDYNTLDRFTSEVRPDKLVSAAVSNNELVLFSASSAEFFQNSGASEQPFRTKRITMDKGAAGAYVVATADNTVYWLGNDGVFYQLDGYTPRRISYRPIEQAIRGLNWEEAFAFVWEDEGHTVIYWTFPDGQTWGFDASEREWHRRESYGLERWRVSGMAYWNNQWIAGDFQKGRLWTVDWEYPWEGEQEFVSSRTLGVIHDNQSRMLHSRLELVMDTGMPYVDPETFSAQPDPPTITGAAPDGIVSEAYTHTYTLADGSPPYVVSLRSGTLPAGLTLSAAGVLSGTPTVEGEGGFTVRVTDSNGLYDDLVEEIAIVGTMPVLITNLGYYIGPGDGLIDNGGEMGWGIVEEIGTVSVSQDGMYAAASSAASVVSPFFEISKYDPGTGLWTILADPADMPARGPRGVVWSNDGNYLLLVDTEAGNENWLVYERSGDTFTKVPDPSVFLNAGASSGSFDFTASRVVVTNANTANVIGVYPFLGISGFGAEIDGLGVGGEQALGPRFQPVADSPYVAFRTATRLIVADVSVDPITVVDTLTIDITKGHYWLPGGNYLIGIPGTTANQKPQLIEFSAGVLTLVGEADVAITGSVDSTALSPNGRFLAIARQTVSTTYPPQIFEISSTVPPTITRLDDPATIGGLLYAVSWSAVND